MWIINLEGKKGNKWRRSKNFQTRKKIFHSLKKDLSLKGLIEFQAGIMEKSRHLGIGWEDSWIVWLKGKLLQASQTREQVTWEEKRTRLKPHMSFARKRKASYASKVLVTYSGQNKIFDFSELPCIGNTPQKGIESGNKWIQLETREMNKRQNHPSMVSRQHTNSYIVNSKWIMID